MPTTQPPNLEALPHELATFVVRGMLHPSVDDDLAAQVESTFVEVIAEELLNLEGNVKARLEELLPDLAEQAGVTLPESPVTVDLEPEGMIAAQRARLVAQ